MVKYVVNWPARLRDLANFVGLSDEDRQLIQDSGPIILDNSEELTGVIYDNFIKFPYSRKFFLNEQGEVDEVRLERRKHTLGRWFRGTISFTMDESFAVAALATGIAHSHPPTHRAHLGPIPARQMIGTMSFIQTAVADLLFREMDDHKTAVKASAAWNKLLMLQLDILLAGYMKELMD